MLYLDISAINFFLDFRRFKHKNRPIKVYPSISYKPTTSGFDKKFFLHSLTTMNISIPSF